MSEVNVYELRKAILREFKNYFEGPLNFKNLKQISKENAIQMASDDFLQEQINELYMHGFLKKFHNAFKCFRITLLGLQQLDVEYEHDRFIEGNN